MSFKEALYYKKKDNLDAECLLCPHHCIIKPDKAGVCGVRVNKDGRLIASNYGEV
ncbi:MAG: AmmeMemoRadiSam system radical SAM enzyme, partial [Spirochaetae bacterium HGW-Spirochaetae-5]